MYKNDQKLGSIKKSAMFVSWVVPFLNMRIKCASAAEQVDLCFVRTVANILS